MNARLLNASGVYIDGLESNGSQSTHASQHANAFPLALGIVPAAQQASVASLVVSSNMSVSALGILQLVRALGEANQGPALLNIYTNANQYGWARILALGGTATWESWTANTDGNSESHGWGAVGLDGYVRYILGVEPLTAQFDQVQIKPLDFSNSVATASGMLLTERGAISVEWDRNATKYHLAVTIPVNVTATVYVPQAGGTNTIVNIDGTDVVGTLTNGYIGVSGIGSGMHAIQHLFNALPPFQFGSGSTNLQMMSNGFKMQVSGVNGNGSVVIYASTNLFDWMPILTNPASSGTILFTDPAANVFPKRFYKATEQ
jgi:alpha-L-rhamnosidase